MKWTKYSAETRWDITYGKLLVVAWLTHEPRSDHPMGDWEWWIVGSPNSFEFAPSVKGRSRTRRDALRAIESEASRLFGSPGIGGHEDRTLCGSTAAGNTG